MSFDDPCTLHKEGPIITMQIMAGGGGGGGQPHARVMYWENQVCISMCSTAYEAPMSY